MTKNYLLTAVGEKSPGRNHRLSSAVAVALASVLTTPAALAVEIDTGTADFTVRWDNTLKYSAMRRLKAQDAALTSPALNSSNANLNDGDNNFNQGIVSNRMDLFSEMDAAYKNLGFRVSGAGWYDTVYNRSNDNNAVSANSISAGANQFTSATAKLHGRKAELLDAFVYGKFDFDDGMASTVRLGKHTLLWGESLFFGANGIAGGQAPMDLIKLLSVPSSQFKEIIRPVGQLSGSFRVNPNFSLGAYYQYQWESNRVPAAGSYLSFTDVLDVGGERFLLGAPPAALFRGNDQKAKDSGQYGLQARFRPEGMDSEYGLYAINFHSKVFSVYLRPGVNAGSNPAAMAGDYQMVYPEDIRAYGTSFSTTVGSANVGGEVSVRRNTPLVNPGMIVGALSNNNGNPAYPVGNSAHAQISTIYLLPPSVLWAGGSFLGEVAWNRRTSVTKNAAALDPGLTRDAWGFRMILEPAYYQVMPGLDVKVPIGLGYNPKGRSSVVSLFNGGVDKGGDVSIGLAGEYQKALKFGMTYSHFLGSKDSFFNGSHTLSFKQMYKDRDFISFSAQYTF